MITRLDPGSVPRISAVDLFCGAGGLTNGLKRTGIDVRLGVDVDRACEYPYTVNNKAKFLLKSVADLELGELERVLGKKGVRLLAGCAPCQTFSTYYQKATPSDERWWLLAQFSRIVEGLLPELVTMENVPGLERQGVFEDFLDTLEKGQYHVSHELVDCADYGVPQRRLRLVLLASRLGPVRLLTPAEFGAERSTVRQSIADMPPLEAGQVDENDFLHQTSTLSATNMARMKASRPGGTWRDWEEALVADCHRKRTGKTYPSVYGRMFWDEPAPTITTQFFGFGNGRFGHPEQDRAISMREGAILQSFPRDYAFLPLGQTMNKKVVGKLIGNAVPVRLGEVIGLSLIEHVREHEEKIRRIHRGENRNDR